MYRDHDTVVFSPLCHFENRSRFPLTKQPIKLIRSSLGHAVLQPSHSFQSEDPALALLKFSKSPCLTKLLWGPQPVIKVFPTLR